MLPALVATEMVLAVPCARMPMAGCSVRAGES